MIRESGESVIRRLRSDLEAMGSGSGGEPEKISSGMAVLDQLLDGKAGLEGEGTSWKGNTPPSEENGGSPRWGCRPVLKKGSIVEWLAEEPGSGDMTLSLQVGITACRRGKGLVLIDRGGDFYPPALRRSGFDHRQILFVRPRDQTEELWAWEQSLRSLGVGAVIGRLGRVDDGSLRRLQLAAERGRTLGMLLRLASVRREPCWADFRLLVESRPWGTSRDRDGCPAARRRLRLTVLRARGAAEGRTIEVLWDEVTSSLSLDPSLGNPATAPWPARA